jgi:DNA-binding XRE family transcriptional regulator
MLPGPGRPLRGADAHVGAHAGDSSVKAVSFDQYLKEQLKRSEVRAAYDDLEEEYRLIEQVIRFRLRNNLTQAQLAKLAGTSPSAIARLESGDFRNMKLGFLARVAGVLELRLEIRFLPLMTVGRKAQRRRGPTPDVAAGERR